MPVTLLMGFVVDLGRRLHSYNLGALLYALLQSCLSAAAYAYCVALSIRMRVPKGVTVCMLAFYALCPLFSGYAQQLYKDGLFAASFALSVAAAASTMLAWERHECVGANQWAILVAASVVACVFRKNGVISIAPLFLAMLVYLGVRHVRDRRREQRRLAALLFVVMALSGGVCYVAEQATGAQPGSIKEALSVPFQQTVRYMRDHADDVTQQERAAIDAVLDVDRIATAYRPHLSDYVKDTFRQDCTTEDLARYFGAWAAMLLRHPGCYVQATIANTYGCLFTGGVLDDHVDRYLMHMSTDPDLHPEKFGFHYVGSPQLRGPVF